MLLIESDNHAPPLSELSNGMVLSYAVYMVYAGSSVGSENHNVIGPCNLTDLTEAAMDYWALGHIHKSQVLSEEPLVVYAGNSQGLHRKEHGS
ncbi:MAG: metallophosphoesterase family protein [Veillonella parvula]